MTQRGLDLFRALILISLLVIGWIWALTSNARSHDWYDRVCCSEDDCRAATTGEIKFDKGRMFVKNTTNPNCQWFEIEPNWQDHKMSDGKTRYRESPDGLTHVCFFMQNCRPVCVYAGLGG